MPGFVLEYLPLVIFIAVAIGIGVALLVAPFAVAYSSPDAEKLSAYECGFNAFDDARMKFDVRFYLVSLGGCVQGGGVIRVLVDDGISGCSHNRLYL